MLDLIQQYWLEFFTIATLHLLAVASPGPDFAVVLKHSIQYGRRAALFTSVGIGVAILLHVTYSLLGLGIIIKTTPWLFTSLMYVAAAYLLYLGYGALKSGPPKQVTDESLDVKSTSISDRKAFWIGVLTNGFNPKATLFFLSVFAVAVAPETPNLVKGMYGLYMAIATAVWFCGLSLVLGSVKVRSAISRKGYWFDRLMGVALIGLAVKLVSNP